MNTTDVIIIGAGQAGLAASHCLGRRGIDHVVLERGRVAERWRSERWDSLRLLTPNWMSRLPGFSYRGDQPDGFALMPDVVEFFERYAAISAAPVQSHTQVLGVDRHASGYRVRTDRGDYCAPEVVLATGYCDVPRRPSIAGALAGRVQQLAPTEYRNPDALAPGGVLVVGASASGAQIALELARSGREVTLAVGRHTPVPRRYRGIDIMAWLDRIGSLDETPDDVGDLQASIDQPSLQLMGSDPPRDLDLSLLMQHGVRLCGRVARIAGTRVSLADDLLGTVQAAEQKLQFLLARIDRYASVHRVQCDEAVPPAPTRLGAGARPVRALDLRAEGIASVVWATGFGRNYDWLHVPVLDARGEIVQTRGITAADGLYTLGQRFQGTRKSNFIDGVAADAEYVTRHIAARLGFRDSNAA